MLCLKNASNDSGVHKHGRMILKEIIGYEERSVYKRH